MGVFNVKLFHWQRFSISLALESGSVAELRVCTVGTSLVVQWLRLCASAAGGMGSIPGRGTKVQNAA